MVKNYKEKFLELLNSAAEEKDFELILMSEYKNISSTNYLIQQKNVFFTVGSIAIEWEEGVPSAIDCYPLKQDIKKVQDLMYVLFDPPTGEFGEVFEEQILTVCIPDWQFEECEKTEQAIKSFLIFFKSWMNFLSVKK